MRRLVACAAVVVVALVGLPIAGPASADTGAWTARAEEYPATVLERDIEIPMSDGTILRGDLLRPVDADGNTVTDKLPTVVTITAYNKSVQSMAGGLAGGDPSYLVKRGYLHLTVDARGTGSSDGTWCAFCSRENQDSGEVMDWVHEQPWTNGDTAMMGPSYMGIAQIFAAASQPEGLKAIFPQVPGADVYRDVVASGGVLDVGFIPLWIGLVNATAIIPPFFTGTDPVGGLSTLVSHLLGNGAFSADLLLSALGGGEPSYDGEFYTQRSPINVVSDVTVPTFFVSGEYDLFQRGTPLLYENLQQRGVPTKIIIGPWDHLQGSGGTGIEDAGYGTLAELQLRWFDHYVKGLPDQDLDQIAGLSYYEQGSGDWARGDAWMPDTLKATTYTLSGSATTGGAAGELTTATPEDGETLVPPIPVQGLCTRSTNQWTAGLLTMVVPDLPCFTDNRFNDLLGPVFETEPLSDDLVIHGPADVRLYTSTPVGNGVYSVTLSDVAPDGSVSRLSGGWQLVAARELDTSRSRYIGDTLVQPYHPFTKESRSDIAPGAVEPVDVEIFPTRARLLAGHRLRVSVQGFDTPHILPTLGDLSGMLVPLTVHTGTEYPSSVSFGSPTGAVPTTASQTGTDATTSTNTAVTRGGRTTGITPPQTGSTTSTPQGTADPVARSVSSGTANGVVPVNADVGLLPETGAQTYAWLLLLAWAALAAGHVLMLRADVSSTRSRAG